jgi:hypothetical protein
MQELNFDMQGLILADAVTFIGLSYRHFPADTVTLAQVLLRRVVDLQQRDLTNPSYSAEKNVNHL